MLVRMVKKIGGFRDGVAWPEVGETIDVPDHEASGLVGNGYAREATDAATAAGPEGDPTDDAGADAADDGDPTPAASAVKPKARKR